MLAGGWWTVPAAIGAVGAGALGWVGVRVQRAGRIRRLELDAALHDVRAGRQALTRSRAAVHAARAAVARAEADRLAGRASPADVAGARRELQQAQREVRAASTDLTARRADVRAARASVPSRADGPQALPLPRLMATHDAISTEWIAYEIDPAKALSYPSMTDVREPLTAVFLREQQAAQWLRPASADARMAPADYAAYRDAVRRMSRAFAAAQREARRRAGESGPDDPRPDWWTNVQGLWEGASRTLAWSADAAARASQTWAKRPGKRPPSPDSSG
jgi:hypothetical protein